MTEPTRHNAHVEALDDGALDELAIHGVEAVGHHGVFEVERRDGQVFKVDLVLGLDTRPAAASDELRDTVDYGTLVAGVVEVIQGEPVELIEKLAARIADVALADARVRWAEVTVHKPDAPIEATFADVALTIRRRRND